MSAITDLGSLLFPKEKPYQVYVPKDIHTLARTDTLFGDYDRAQQLANKYFNLFEPQHAAGQFDAEQRARTEVASALTPLYNNQRKAEDDARRQTTFQNLLGLGQRARAENQKQSKETAVLSGRPAGEGSFDRRLAALQDADILRQSELWRSQSQTADAQRLEALQLGNLGRATAVADAPLARLLQAPQVYNSLNAANTNALANLSNIRLANSFYGVGQDIPDGAKAFAVADQAIQDILSIYGGGGYSGGGGGKVSGGGGGGQTIGGILGSSGGSGLTSGANFG